MDNPYHGVASDLTLVFGAEITRAIERELRLGIERERTLAKVRQMQAAQGRNPRRMIDGLGQTTMQVDPEAYHYWGQRIGYGCWRDRTFRREFRRDNPETRVQSERKAMIVRP